MSDHSAIEWTDATWNPVTGCTKVSPGCDHCYAETFAERFRGVPGHHFEQGFDVALRPEGLERPLRWRKPRRIFVNSMSDLFHKDVPDEYIARVFAVMAATPQHTYQILTKRHARMRSLLSTTEFDLAVADAWCRMGTAAGSLHEDFTPPPYPLPNVWLGVSVETQQWADIRIPALLDTPAAVRWISAEPLLGPVDLAPWLNPHQFCDGCDNDYGHGCKSCPWNKAVVEGHDFDPRSRAHPARTLGWVVAGGESGPGARPMHPDWARQIRDQCQAAGVPFLFKQWGAWAPQPIYATDDRHHVVMLDGTDRGTPWSGWALDQPAAAVMERVGKKAAGRVLDGRTWDQYPG